MHHDDPLPGPNVTVAGADLRYQREAAVATVDTDEAADDEEGEDGDDNGDDGEHDLSFTMDHHRLGRRLS